MPPDTRSALSKFRVTPDPALPPDLRALGALPFTETQRDRLRNWLNEAGWPRGRMNFEMLEGYLVALLVWPVGLPSGA